MVLRMSAAVWLVGIMEKSKILILLAVSMVLRMSVVWLVGMMEKSQIHTGTFTGLVEAIVWVRVQAVVAQVKMAAIPNQIIGTTVLTLLWLTGISLTSG